MPYLVRERIERDGFTYFVIQGDEYEANQAIDVTVPYNEPKHKGSRNKFPRCPDCAGELHWHNIYSVPGSYKCYDCESQFNDSDSGLAYSTRGY